MASQRVVIPPFNGGLSWSREPEYVENDALVDLLNFHISDRGELIGRGGHNGSEVSALGGTADRRGVSGHYFERTTAEDQILIIDTAGELWRNTYVGGSPAWPTWTSIATGYGNLLDVAPQMVTYNGFVWIGNSEAYVSDYSRWSGTTRTTYASAPQGTILEVWKERVWVSGVNSQPDRVYASNIGDPTTFSALDFVDVGKGDGRGITAMKTNGDVLLVAKHDRIYFIYDPVTFANRRVVEGLGPHSKNGVLVHENIFYFIGDQGIYRMSPDGPLEKLTGELDGVFDLGTNSPFSSGGSSALLSGYVHGRHHIGFLMDEIGGAALPNVAIDINLQNPGRPASLHRVPVHLIFHGLRSTHGRPALWGFASNTNKVYRCFDSGSVAAGKDDGATFKRQAVTKFYDFDSPLVTKYIRRLKIAGNHDGSSGDKVTVKLFTDWERDTPVKSYDIDFEPAGGNLYNDASIDVDLYCRSLSIHIESTPSTHTLKEFFVGGTEYNEPIGTPRIGRIEVEYTPLGDRRTLPTAVVTYL